MWQLIAACGILIGIALTLIIAELLPKQPRLADSLERLGTTTRSRPDSRGGDSQLETRIGAFMTRRLPPSPLTRIPQRDLDIIEWAPAHYLTVKVLFALLGLVLPSVLVAVAWVFGITIPIAAAAGIPLAIGFYFLPNLVVNSQAKERRGEFSLAVASYVELVGMAQRGGQGPTAALERAAGTADNWIFARIREQLVRARYANDSPWDGLRGLSDQIGVPELRELADIVRLSGEENADIYASLRAKGSSLRTTLLSRENTRANERSEKMTIPMSLLGLILVVILMYPQISQILQ